MMRVSIIKDDVGYKNYSVAKANGKTVHVFLDGIEEDCVTADEENGFIERAVTDDAGNLVLDEMKENIVREIVKGVVRIEIRMPNPAPAPP